MQVTTRRGRLLQRLVGRRPSRLLPGSRNGQLPTFIVKAGQDLPSFAIDGDHDGFGLVPSGDDLYVCDSSGGLVRRSPGR